MSIVNLTNDSFYANSRKSGDSEILLAVENALNSGAKIIDIGAYSTRPDADIVDKNTELSKIRNATEIIIKNFPDCVLSIDTFRSEVANIALNEGAGLINDVSGLSEKEEMLKVLKTWQCPYILMHIKSGIHDIKNEFVYENLYTEMVNYFSEKINILKKSGVNDIILDLGYGFSKNTEQNHYLLRNNQTFNIFQYPILAGISRKSMWHKPLNSGPENVLHATSIGHYQALMGNNKFLRVHDVKEAMDIIHLLKL